MSSGQILPTILVFGLHEVTQNQSSLDVMVGKKIARLSTKENHLFRPSTSLACVSVLVLVVSTLTLGVSVLISGVHTLILGGLPLTSGAGFAKLRRISALSV